LHTLPLSAESHCDTCCAHVSLSIPTPTHIPHPLQNHPEWIDVNVLADATNALAAAGKIDNTTNLKDDQVCGLCCMHAVCYPCTAVFLSKAAPCYSFMQCAALVLHALSFPRLHHTINIEQCTAITRALHGRAHSRPSHLPLTLTVTRSLFYMPCLVNHYHCQVYLHLICLSRSQSLALCSACLASQTVTTVRSTCIAEQRMAATSLARWPRRFSSTRCLWDATTTKLRAYQRPEF
jgi:hypothetical protein